MARDVAEWIEHSDVSMMMKKIDNDEKVTNNVCTPGGVQKAWFLTENGLYEVLMLSRKPKAKQFKSKIKEILKSVRKTGGGIPDHRSSCSLLHPLHLIFSPKIASMLSCTKLLCLAAPN